MPSFTVFKGQANGTPKKGVTTKPDELVGDSVLVKVTASGVCGTGMSKNQIYETEQVLINYFRSAFCEHLRSQSNC